MLIDDDSVKVNDVKSVVFVTGKFYYDLLEERDSLKRTNVALVRVEQLFPLPLEAMSMVIKKYKNADDMVWAQEEPRNMGAYSHILMHFDEARQFRVASRRVYSAPSAGSSVRSKLRHQEVINFVFDKSKNNQ